MNPNRALFPLAASVADLVIPAGRKRPEMVLSEHDLERFFRCFTVGEADECWEWTGTVIDKKPGLNYGRMWIKGDHVQAHRLSFALATGAFPAATLQMCHRCDNPPCVNPRHLFAGTPTDNMQDMTRKGRSWIKNNQHIVCTLRKPVTGEQHYRAKLKDDDVREIIELLKRGASQTAVAKRFGVNQTNISGIARGKTWKHLQIDRLPPVTMAEAGRRRWLHSKLARVEG